MPRAKPAQSATSKAKPIPKAFDSHSLKLNDHVFVSPPWSYRMGEPYQIARVMDLLPPTPVRDSRSRAAASSSNSTIARVRVNYYLRVRDITNRYLADHRLILATMHTAVVPVSYIRSLCIVKHKDTIRGDLEAYKREKDTFYWHQLYDRYLHRYFDTVPTSKLQNAPEPILRHLKEHFDWILCETGFGVELCDAKRGCSSCSKWASTPESITCAHCQKVFHLTCLDPPLFQKPRTGYSFSCAPCAKAHDEEVEEYMRTGIPPVKKAAAEGNGPKSKTGKGKKKEVLDDAGTISYGKTTNGWPFRYFGMHTEAYSVLDPHDSLYPRASTRLGNRYQAAVPDWDSTSGVQIEKSEPARVYFIKRNRAGTPVLRSEKFVKKDDAKDFPTRGADSDVERLLKVSPLDEDATLDEIHKLSQLLPIHSTVGVDVLSHALSEARTGIPAQDTIDIVNSTATVESLGHGHWEEEEKIRMTEAAVRWGNDIVRMKEEVFTGYENGGMEIGKVVKTYYITHGASHSLVDDAPESERATILRKSRSAQDPDSDDESLCGSPVKSGRKCVICDLKTSLSWFRCPETVGESGGKGEEHLMCEGCSIRWRHFGISSPPSPEELDPKYRKRK